MESVSQRVAYRDELPASSEISGRDTGSSFDFAIYDGQVATEVYNQAGKYFGCKTREASLVADYQRLFDLIEHGSHPFLAEIAGCLSVQAGATGLTVHEAVT